MYKEECNHCWHAYRGPIWMVIPDGHVLEKCCKCDATQTVHFEHLRRTATSISKTKI